MSIASGCRLVYVPAVRFRALCRSERVPRPLLRGRGDRRGGDGEQRRDLVSHAGETRVHSPGSGVRAGVDRTLCHDGAALGGRAAGVPWACSSPSSRSTSPGRSTRGSDKWPQTPALCAIPAVAWVPKRQSRMARLADEGDSNSRYRMGPKLGSDGQQGGGVGHEASIPT